MNEVVKNIEKSSRYDVMSNLGRAIYGLAFGNQNGSNEISNNFGCYYPGFGNVNPTSDYYVAILTNHDPDKLFAACIDFDAVIGEMRDYDIVLKHPKSEIVGKNRDLFYNKFEADLRNPRIILNCFYQVVKKGEEPDVNKFLPIPQKFGNDFVTIGEYCLTYDMQRKDRVVKAKKFDRKLGWIGYERLLSYFNDQECLTSYEEIPYFTGRTVARLYYFDNNKNLVQKGVIGLDNSNRSLSKLCDSYVMYTNTILYTRYEIPKLTSAIANDMIRLTVFIGFRLVRSVLNRFLELYREAIIDKPSDLRELIVGNINYKAEVISKIVGFNFKSEYKILRESSQYMVTLQKNVGKLKESLGQCPAVIYQNDFLLLYYLYVRRLVYSSTENNLEMNHISNLYNGLSWYIEGLYPNTKDFNNKSKKWEINFGKIKAII